MERSGADPNKRTDESWKDAARREKERLQEEAEKSVPRELPPATFMNLLGDLSLQAMLALGLIGPEGEKERMVDLHAARYIIDTLSVLDEKTRGNLAPEEEENLTQLLHNLRLRFVDVSRLVAEQAARPPAPKAPPEKPMGKPPGKPGQPPKQPPEKKSPGGIIIDGT